MKKLLTIVVLLMFFAPEAMACGRWSSLIASCAALEKQKRTPVATVLKKVVAPIQRMRAPIPDSEDVCTGSECKRQNLRRIFRR